MIIEKELYGTKERFFDVLLQATLEDIQVCTGKEMEKKDLKEGFSYSKQIKNKKNHPGKAKISRLRYPDEFTLKVKSESGTTTLDYKLRQVDDCIRVIYKEEFIDKNGKVTDGLFYRRSIKKRVNLYFKQIQEYMNKEL